MNPYKYFLKRALAEKTEVSTGHQLLDRAFKVPLKSFLLLKGEAYSGCTALALELAAKLTQDHTVVFIDITNSVMAHRLWGMDESNLVILRAWDLEPEDFVKIVRELYEVEENLILIFENVTFLEYIWGRKHCNFAELARQLKAFCPEITVISTQRKKKHYDIWTYVVDIEKIQAKYEETEDSNQCVGHLLKVSGPKGRAIVYVDYFTGRISQAYEQAFIEIESGTKTKTSTFEWQNLKIQGVWKFIYEVGKYQRNELQTSKLPNCR